MEKIIVWLKENLSDERFRHSIATARVAELLAIEFNLDEKKAKLAGLVHDCAKEIPYEQMFIMVKDNNLQEKMEISSQELNTKKVLHAPLSAFLAEEIFCINDEEILNAVRFHTIGRLKMSDFEKIIFLADKIEPETRLEDHFEELRQELKRTKSLDKTMLLCAKMTIKSLLDRDLPINSDSISLYNDLLKNN